TQDAIGIRVGVMIKKFSPNKTVIYASHTYSFPNGCFLLVIEGKGDQEHIVEADVMSTYCAKSETRARDILNDHTALLKNFVSLCLAFSIRARQLRFFTIEWTDDNSDTKQRSAGASDFERLGEVFHICCLQGFATVTCLTGKRH